MNKDGCFVREQKLPSTFCHDHPSYCSAAEICTFKSGDLRQGLSVSGRVEEGSWYARREEGTTWTDRPVDAADHRHFIQLLNEKAHPAIVPALSETPVSAV